MMAQINIRMDDDLKDRADKLFEELGLSMTAAVTMFVRQSVREGGIPFDVTTKVDPLHNEENLRALRRAIQDANDGKLTPHELIED